MGDLAVAAWLNRLEQWTRSNPRRVVGALFRTKRRYAGLLPELSARREVAGALDTTGSESLDRRHLLGHAYDSTLASRRSLYWAYFGSVLKSLINSTTLAGTLTENSRRSFRVGCASRYLMTWSRSLFLSVSVMLSQVEADQSFAS